MAVGPALRDSLWARAASSVVAALLAAPMTWLQPLPVHAAPDEVVRVLDQNTVKLKRAGVTRLAGMSTPTLNLPECFSFAPSSHLRRELPPRTRVEVDIEPSPGTPKRAFVTRTAPDGLSVNERLVAGGWAKAVGGGSGGDERYASMRKLQRAAQAAHMGVWMACDARETVVARYDELGPPASEPAPIEVRTRCGEYRYFEDAKRAFDADPVGLSRLDSDGDGVPCAGLPHRPELERRQLKTPTSPAQQTTPGSGAAAQR